MTNKVEILRSVCFTKEDMDTITNLANTFTDKEIEFMVEFKKIYELGVSQLEKFINKLDSEGSVLDEYTIMYYVKLLYNGPLAEYTKVLGAGKKYFVKSPDSLGTFNNVTRGPSNNTLFIDKGYQLGTSNDVYNKLPSIAQNILDSSINITENIFRSSLRSTMDIDNTLPIVDKRSADRYKMEPEGTWTSQANGSQMVKDSFYYTVISKIAQQVSSNVNQFLGDEDFRIYKSKKYYNPFDPLRNLTQGKNTKIEKVFTDNDSSRTVPLDLLGDEFDSEERRSRDLNVNDNQQNREYNLNTNKGQLGI